MYHVLPLTIEQIRGGILFQISDALSAAFDRGAKTIREEGLRVEPDEMSIFFENSSTNPNFHADHDQEDLQDVLYLNDAAKEEIERAGVVLETAGTVDVLPEGHGLMARMYRFVNLR